MSKILTNKEVDHQKSVSPKALCYQRPPIISASNFGHHCTKRYEKKIRRL